MESEFIVCGTCCLVHLAGYLASGGETLYLDCVMACFSLSRLLNSQMFDTSPRGKVLCGHKDLVGSSKDTMFQLLSQSKE